MARNICQVLLAGDIEGALEVDAAIAAAGIEITEAEYAVFLAAYREAGPGFRV